jgi:hypothetical protein
MGDPTIVEVEENRSNNKMCRLYAHVTSSRKTKWYAALKTSLYPDSDFRLLEDGLIVLVRPMNDAAREWATIHLPAPDDPSGAITVSGSLWSVLAAITDAGLTYVEVRPGALCDE